MAENISIIITDAETRKSVTAGLGLTEHSVRIGETLLAATVTQLHETDANQVPDDSYLVD